MNLSQNPIENDPPSTTNQVNIIESGGGIARAINKTTLILTYLALFIFGLVIGGVFGASHGKKSPSHEAMLSISQANVIINHLTDGKATVLKTFPGPRGLTGMVLQPQGQPSVIGWVMNNEDAIIIGGVIDAKTNVNLTSTAISTELVKGGPAPAALSAITGNPAGVQPGTQGAQVAAPMPQAQTAPVKDPAVISAYLDHPNDNPALTQPGTAGPHTLYVFFDPNCIFCHQIYDTIGRHTSQFKAAGIRVEYVPVAILKQTSIGMSTAIEKGGFAALQANERGFNSGTETGGIAPMPLENLSPADTAYLSKVHENTRMLVALSQAAGRSGAATPTLVWRSGDGTPSFLAGAPDDAGLEKIIASFSKK